MSPRGVDWSAVLGGSMFGAAILTGCVLAATDGPPLGFVRLALLALAVAAAFILDEPAAAAVDAVPSTRRHRTADRAAAAVLPFAAWVAGVLALELRNAVAEAGALIVEGAGLIAVAVALAAVVRWAGHVEPGEIAASVLGPAVLAVLVLHPPPRSVPIFPMVDGWAASTALWSVMAWAAAMIVVATSADLYCPRRRLRSALARTIRSSAMATSSHRRRSEEIARAVRTIAAGDGVYDGTVVDR